MAEKEEVARAKERVLWCREKKLLKGDGVGGYDSRALVVSIVRTLPLYANGCLPLSFFLN